MAELILNIDHVPHKIGTKDLQTIQSQVASELNKFGISGKWRINDLRVDHRSRDRMNNRSVLIKSITGVKGQPNTRGIRFTTKTGNSRYETFTGLLVPSSQKSIDKVYTMLVTAPAAERNIPEIDATFLARTASIKADGLDVKFYFNGEQHTAFCPIIEFDNIYIESLENHILQDRYIYVQVTTVDETKITVSRKVLLPHGDKFDTTPMKKNNNDILRLRGFTMSEERVLIALEAMRTSIERHANKKAWDSIGTIGGVFMLDESSACAPAELVRKDLRRAILKQYTNRRHKPSNTTTLRRIIEKLVQRGYIRIANMGGVNAIGYCMTSAGYEVLRCEPPPLPEYYEPTIDTTDTDVDTTNTDLNDQGADMPNTEEPELTLEAILPLIKEFKEKEQRLKELNTQLEGYDLLCMERDEVQAWLDQHPDILKIISTVKE